VKSNISFFFSFFSSFSFFLTPVSTVRWDGHPRLPDLEDVSFFDYCDCDCDYDHDFFNLFIVLHFIFLFFFKNFFSKKNNNQS